jgi:hypothetical protein
MIDLNNITLLTVMGRKIQSKNENFVTIDKILSICNNFLNFKKIKILNASNECYKFNRNNLEIIKIEPLNQREYNKFCVKELIKYVDTDFVLIFQTDGFIINPELWNDNFLNYDYIGAPWPDNMNSRVGNGGFSLRSKKFLEVTSKLEYIDGIGLSGGEFTPEDHLNCRYNYNYLIEKNIKFAPIEVAIKFSFEQKIKEFPNWDNTMSLGFHGLFQSGWDNDEFRTQLKEKFFINEN